MRREIEKIKREVKRAPIGCGIDISPLYLSREEKKKLVEEGFTLHVGRNNQLILTYSQRSRQEDLRRKVLSSWSQRIKKWMW